MKNKDQILLEEAYSKISKAAIFRDKKGNPLRQGDSVVYNSKMYKIVGGKTILGTGIKKDQIQLEDEERKFQWVLPHHTVKVS